MEKIKEVYNAGFAREADLIASPRIHKVVEAIQHNLEINVKSILDIGCGDGFVSKTIADLLQANEVFGVDIAFGSQALAKQNGIDVHILDIDTEPLPFEDDKFDFIYCGSLIELVLNPDHLLSEISRTLKPNGVAVITNPNLSSWLNRVVMFMGYLPYYGRVSTQFEIGKFKLEPRASKSTGFIRLFTTHALRQLLELHKFQILEVFGVSDETLPRSIRLIDGLFCRRPSLAWQNIWFIQIAR